MKRPLVQTNTTNHLFHIGDDCLEIVLSYLSLPDLTQVATTCHYLRHIATTTNRRDPIEDTTLQYKTPASIVPESAFLRCHVLPRICLAMDRNVPSGWQQTLGPWSRCRLALETNTVDLTTWACLYCIKLFHVRLETNQAPALAWIPRVMLYRCTLVLHSIPVGRIELFAAYRCHVQQRVKIGFVPELDVSLLSFDPDTSRLKDVKEWRLRKSGSLPWIGQVPGTLVTDHVHDLVTLQCKSLTVRSPTPIVWSWPETMACPNLQRLLIHKCMIQTSSQAGFDHIRELRLRQAWFENITGSGLAVLSRLEILEIHTPRSHESSLECLDIQHMQSLHTLIIRNMPEVDAWIHDNPQLRTLEIDHDTSTFLFRNPSLDNIQVVTTFTEDETSVSLQGDEYTEYVNRWFNTLDHFDYVVQLDNPIEIEYWANNGVTHWDANVYYPDWAKWQTVKTI